MSFVGKHHTQHTRENRLFWVLNIEFEWITIDTIVFQSYVCTCPKADYEYKFARPMDREKRGR